MRHLQLKMGVVDGFKSASIFGKISFILLFIASFCIVIAFTCTGWAESNENFGGGSQIHWGLWRRCTENEVSTAPCSPLDGWANGRSQSAPLSIVCCLRKKCLKSLQKTYSVEMFCVYCIIFETPDVSQKIFIL